MEIVYYTPNDHTGSVMGFLKVRIPKWNLEIDGLKLIRGKNGGRFIGFPSKRREENGEVTYDPIIKFGKGSSGQFQEAALKAIDEFTGNAPPPSKPRDEPNNTPVDMVGREG